MITRLLRPAENILLVTCNSLTALGRMFVRPQEFFESPSARFRGRYFPLPAFERYYRKRWGNGRFTYYTDFQGYNFPGEVFLDWQKAFASNETEDEQKLLRLLGPLPEKFYVIGALERDAGTIGHELSHALFHLNEGYRETALFHMERFQADLAPLRRALRKIMYREEVLDDECVSYLIFEQAWMRRQGLRLKPLELLATRLRVNYIVTSGRAIRPRGEW